MTFPTTNVSLPTGIWAKPVSLSSHSRTNIQREPNAGSYEQLAACLGLALLHEMGVTDMHQWLTDSAETDWRYVERFYRDGALPKWEECLVTGSALFKPIRIQSLERRKVHVSFAF